MYATVSRNWKVISDKTKGEWVKCVGPESQIGKLKPFMADIPISLWGKELLQQWSNQINIPAIAEIAHDEIRGELVGAFRECIDVCY